MLWLAGYLAVGAITSTLVMWFRPLNRDDSVIAVVVVVALFWPVAAVVAAAYSMSLLDEYLNRQLVGKAKRNNRARVATTKHKQCASCFGEGCPDCRKE